MTWTDQLIRAALRLPARPLRRAIADPIAAKARTWDRLWHRVRDSVYWRQHAPSDRLEDFPIRTYEDYRDAIEVGFRDGTRQLSTLPVQFYATTGGTTANRPKRFPLTADYGRQLRLIGTAFAHSLATRTVGLGPGKVLTMTASAPTETSPHGVPVGYVSWYAGHVGGGASQRLSAFPPELLADDARMQAWGPLYALASDLRMVSAVNASKVRTFAEAVHAGRDRWPRYLRGEPLPAGLPPIRVRPERVAHLERMWAEDRHTLADLWPTLRGVVCWKAGVSALQLQTARPWLGGLAVRDAPLVCTEAWLTVPLWDDRPGVVLHPEANVVEFIPVGTDEIRQAWELEPGQDYELLLTTDMGLVRYRVFDVVRCTGFVARSPVLVFRHKAAFTLRLGQVSLAESDVVAALAALGVSPARTWCLGPNDTGDGLCLRLRDAGPERPEPDVAAEEARLRALLPALDAALAAALPVYGHDRSVGWMVAPSLERLDGAHTLWRQPTHAQAKPRLLIPAWDQGQSASSGANRR
jgi:hypothetical protein